MKTSYLPRVLCLLMALMPIGSPLQAHDERYKQPRALEGNGQIGNMPLNAMSAMPCVNGYAGLFPCRHIDLAAFLPLADIGGGTANDVWGWTDAATGKEYALLGRSNGTAFVDISDAEHPVYLGNLPTHSANSTWRGIKVYANYAYIVSEAAGHGMQVFDLTRLRAVTTAPVTFTENAHYSAFATAHTLAINEASGYAYAAGSNTCAGGLHMINLQNPASPVFAGCVDNDGYTHETVCLNYHGPDNAHTGKEICFSSNADTLTIVDVTDKSAPRQLSRTGYSGHGYAHQGWLTDDHVHFLMNDELDERQQGVNTRTHIWNISDLDTPFVAGIYEGPSTAVDHNLYIRGRYAYESNYRSGLRILDISNIASTSLAEVGFFDVYPVDDAANFDGTWSNYPFFASGNIIASGIEQGLFVLRPRIPALTLSIAKTGSGSGTVTSNPSGIVCGSDCSEPYPVASTVTLSAQPSSGSLFAAWQEAACADGIVSLTADTLCSARFELGADLVSTSLYAPPAAGAGRGITLTDSTKNKGSGTAGASINRLYLSSDALFDAGDALLGSRSVPALAAGAASSGATAVTIPAATTDGRYNLIAVVDADATVAETAETNNLRLRLLKVGPDLTVANLSAPASVARGTSISITNKVSNRPNLSTAGASTVRLYLSSDALFDAGDVLIATRAVPALAAGSTHTAVTQAVVPLSVAPGNYYLIGVADADAVLTEVNEINNTRARAITLF